MLNVFEIGARYGIIEGLEAGFRIQFSGWDGTIVVPGLPLNSEGGTNIGDMFLEVKYQFLIAEENLPLDSAALLSIKIPSGSVDDALGTGALDISLNCIGTFYAMPELGIFGMLGFTYAMDGDTALNPDDFTRTWGFLFQWGLGATFQAIDMMSIVWQLEFYDPAMDTSLGFKFHFDVGGIHIMPELAFTLGLYKQAADYTIKFGAMILF